MIIVQISWIHKQFGHNKKLESLNETLYNGLRMRSYARTNNSVSANEVLDFDLRESIVLWSIEYDAQQNVTIIVQCLCHLTSCWSYSSWKLNSV